MLFKQPLIVVIGCVLLFTACEGEKPLEQSLKNLSHKIEQAAPGLQQKRMLWSTGRLALQMNMLT